MKKRFDANEKGLKKLSKKDRESGSGFSGKSAAGFSCKRNEAMYFPKRKN